MAASTRRPGVVSPPSTRPCCGTNGVAISSLTALEISEVVGGPVFSLARDAAISGLAAGTASQRPRGLVAITQGSTFPKKVSIVVHLAFRHDLTLASERHSFMEGRAATRHGQNGRSAGKNCYRGVPSNGGRVVFSPMASIRPGGMGITASRSLTFIAASSKTSLPTGRTAVTLLFIDPISTAVTDSVLVAASVPDAVAVSVRPDPALRVSSETIPLTPTASGTASGQGMAVLVRVGNGDGISGRRSPTPSIPVSASTTIPAFAMAALCPTLVCITEENNSIVSELNNKIAQQQLGTLVPPR